MTLLENLNMSTKDQAEITQNQQQLHAERCGIIESVSHEELYLGTTTNDEYRLTKFGTMHSGISNISVSEKEVNDLKNTRELIRTKGYIKKLKKKLNISQHKYKRLQEKATSLSFLIKQLQDGKLLSKDAIKLLEVNVTE